MLVVLVGCALRLDELRSTHSICDGRWVLVDLVAKGGRSASSRSGADVGQEGSSSDDRDWDRGAGKYTIRCSSA